jgi:SAM-dependent methyltransferase
MNSAKKMRTEDHEYSARLVEKEAIWWKKVLDVQAPYRWNLRRLEPGFALDIGCGIGRNLVHLNGNGVGLDHNAYSIDIARSRGLQAFTPDEFQQSDYNAPARFDSILLSHLAEHMTAAEATALLQSHLHLLRPGGQVIFITPQEAGYRSDPTHVQFMDFAALRDITSALELSLTKEFSFPLPRFFGSLFKYNEFVSVSKKL